MQSTIPLWFIPSFYGDIRLEATGQKSCVLITEQLTPTEKEAIDSLLKQADKKKRGLRTTLMSGDGNSRMTLEAPIDKVSKALAKLVKPGRTIVSAVKFSDGRMEELRSTQSAAPASNASTSRTSAAKPSAAASVAAPVRGCPPPDFTQAEIRAREVLRTFLSPEQIADFNRSNRFISVGATTGNRYMVTSRHARDQLAQFSRTLYDLDRKTPLCVHDWDVPPAEEMLSLHVLLQLPGWENYLRVTEDNMEEALREHMGVRQDLITIHDPFSLA